MIEFALLPSNAKDLKELARIQIGDRVGLFCNLSFNNTTPRGGAVAGQTYDTTSAAPYFRSTTQPLLSRFVDQDTAALQGGVGADLRDFGISTIHAIICLDGSSAAALGGGNRTGCVNLTYNEGLQALLITTHGNVGAADPLTRAAPAETTNTAGALAALSFRVLVIGK